MSDSENTGRERCWDYESCPREKCDGELRQVDRFNAMCLSCEEAWSHVKNQFEHKLVDEDNETVATKPAAVTDGGVEESGNGRSCPGCGSPAWIIKNPETDQTECQRCGEVLSS